MPPEVEAHAGRYVIGEEIASGGMATVHLGRALGDGGFARTVAVKRLHPQLAKDPDFAAMLLDEGRLSSRIRHVNVVPTLDVVAAGADLFVVMEYVHGEPLNGLLRALVRRKDRVPPRIAAAVLAGALRGLHAAHEARDEHGRLLGVVHRDVSPQNIMVGTDGVARVLDFGIAKAAGRAHVTQTGQIKGKFAYMSPEQLHGEALDRRADVYAAGVVLWESLVGARLFPGTDQAPNLARLLDPRVEPPSARVPGLGEAYDAVTLRALSREREDRFPTALAMAEAVEACGPVASAAEVGAFVQATAGEALAERAARIEASERELMARVRDSAEYLEALEQTVTDVCDLPLPPLPAAWMARMEAGGVVATLASAGVVRRTDPPPPDSDDDPTEPQRDALTPAEAAFDETTTAPIAPRQPRRPAPETVRSPGPLRRSAAPWAVLASVGALLVIATAALAGRGRRGDPITPPASAAESSASAPEPAPAATASASAPEPAPAATASASAPEPAPPAPASASAPRAGARPAAPRPRRPEEDCSPPFTIDAAGHKRYKRACLR